MATALAPALFDQVEEALKDVMDPELADPIEDEAFDRFLPAGASTEA